ncbi:MAG: hypothetical protein ABIK38_01565 [candidate division WOR-3 bacterium]
MMYRRWLVTVMLAVTAIPVGSVVADDGLNPEGLFLAVFNADGSYADRSYVAAYIYDITPTEPASLYVIGSTGPGEGNNNIGPTYNICRFARGGALPPGDAIPCDACYRWRFYAWKVINGTTYYSNWSKEMRYSAPDHLYDSDNLYLTRTAPPEPIPPYYANE